MSPRLRAALIAAVALGCAHRQTPKTAALGGPPPELVAEVDAAQNEARGVLVAQTELAWRNWVFGDPLDLAPTYAGHEKLFSKEMVQTVGKLRAQTTDPVARRALAMFRVYLVGELLGRATADLSEQIADLEAVATFNGADGVEHPYRELERLAASERDHSRRVTLFADALPVIERLGPLMEQRRALEDQLLGTLGYDGDVAFGSELREVDFTSLSILADGLLAKTEVAFRAALDRELHAQLGLSLESTRRADLSRFFRTVDLDSSFPPDHLLDRLRDTLDGLGLDLAKQQNIRIDDKPLPNKNPRAACFRVEVPNDIRLSVKPIGGVTDYRGLFHEAGHAEAYANTQSPRFAFRQLGDGAVGEAYALLFEGLLENPLWLGDHANLSGQKLADFVRASAVKRLLALRRHAGRLLFELAWHGGGKEPAAIYRTMLARADGFPVSADDAHWYRLDEDQLFSSADDLRAAVLAAQLEAKLVELGGPRWWAAPAAGELLKKLWAEGSGLAPDELAKRLGATGLDLGPLVAHYTARLGAPANP